MGIRMKCGRENPHPSPTGGEEGESSMELTYTTLRRRPGLEREAAAWFHSKWRVPESAYLACMDACLGDETPYDW